MYLTPHFECMCSKGTVVHLWLIGLKIIHKTLVLKELTMSRLISLESQMLLQVVLTPQEFQVLRSKF